MKSSKLTLGLMMALAGMAVAPTPPRDLVFRRRRVHVDTLPENITPRSRSNRYPQMVTSSDAEIADWNRNVNTRQVRRRSA